MQHAHPQGQKLQSVRGVFIMRCWRALYGIGWPGLAQAERVAEVCACVFVSLCVCVHVRTHVCVYVYRCVCVCLELYVHVCWERRGWSWPASNV